MSSQLIEESIGKHYYWPSVAFGNRINDSLWINFKFRQIKSQHADVTNEAGFRFERGRVIDISMLAPNEFQETISHTWDDASSIGSRLSKVVSHFGHLTEEAAAFSGSTGKLFDDILKSQNVDNASSMYKQFLGKAELVKHYKNDMPMTYKNTGRPEVAFIFNLADEGNGNPYDNVIKPIQLFKMLSSPSKKDPRDVNYYKMPWICEVTSMFGNKPSPIINMKYAAVVSVQTGYKLPYREGIPTTSELTVTVQDLRPVYSNIWENSNHNKITVTHS